MKYVTIDFIRAASEAVLAEAIQMDLRLEECNGYETGRAWKEDYRPGGPFSYNSYAHESAPVKILAKHSQDCRAAWLAGFDRGLAAQQA